MLKKYYIVKEKEKFSVSKCFMKTILIPNELFSHANKEFGIPNKFHINSMHFPNERIAMIWNYNS